MERGRTRDDSSHLIACREAVGVRECPTTTIAKGATIIMATMVEHFGWGRNGGDDNLGSRKKIGRWAIATWVHLSTSGEAKQCGPPLHTLNAGVSHMDRSVGEGSGWPDGVE